MVCCVLFIEDIIYFGYQLSVWSSYLFLPCKLTFCPIDGFPCLTKTFQIHESHLLIIDLSAWAVGVLFMKSPMLISLRLFSLFCQILFTRFYIVVFDPLGHEFCADMIYWHCYTCRHPVTQLPFIVDAFIFQCIVLILCQNSSVIRCVDLLLGL